MHLRGCRAIEAAQVEERAVPPPVRRRAVHARRVGQPTAADVAEWHARYVAALEETFEAHKAQFGYAERKLELM